LELKTQLPVTLKKKAFGLLANITSNVSNLDQKAIAAQLMKNPGVLAALQDRLSSIVGSPSGYIQR